MGKTTIEWCDYTFNPWVGCTKLDGREWREFPEVR